MKTLSKLIMSLSLVAVMFNGCGSSSGDSKTPPANNAPVVTQNLVTKSVTENSSLSYSIISNVTDSDNDDLNVTSLVMADGSALPSGISLSGNNLVVANTISVSDGQNLTYDLNATVSDSEDDVTYSLRVIIQDQANDSLLTYTVNIVTSIDSNETLNGSIILSDNDGVAQNSYNFDLLDRNDSNNSVYSGTITDVGSDNNYTFSIDLSAQNISPSHYALVTQAISPVIGGENPQSDVVITHNFEVNNLAPTWTASSYDTGLTIRDDNDDPKTIKDLTAVSSDADGDAIAYSIVSISTPSVNDDTIWNNSVYIENGVLKVHNLITNDPTFDGTISVVVKVSDGTSSSNTTVNFDFLNLN